MNRESKTTESSLSEEDRKMFEGRASIPYIVYEISERRHEKREIRMKSILLSLVALSLVLLLAIVGTNMAWLYVFQSYDYVSYEQDGEGYNNIITGTNGDIYNGAESENQEEEEWQEPG